MNSNKTLIFDFDGTIADSGLRVVEIINELLTDFGLKKLEDSDIEKLRGKNIKEVIKGFGIPTYQLPFIYLKFEEKYKKVVNDLKPVKDIPDVLRKLHEKGVAMHLASSNSQESIKSFLKKNNLEYFGIIKGSSGVLGKGRIIKKILSEDKIPTENAIYVGDEIRDIESARKAGVRSVAVTWGFNNKKVLEENEPDYLINRPEELLDLWEN